MPKNPPTDTYLIVLRIDDDLVWSLLTNHGKSGNDGTGNGPAAE